MSSKLSIAKLRRSDLVLKSANKSVLRIVQRFQIFSKMSNGLKVDKLRFSGSIYKSG